MKTSTTLVISLCLVPTFAYQSQKSEELVLKPADVSAVDSSPCMNKKISGKVPLVPKMKCRVS